MKKTITQFTAMILFLIIGSSASAQCTGTVNIENRSNDAWGVAAYNYKIVVQPNSTLTLGYTNADPSTGIGVAHNPSKSGTSTCTYTFQSSSDVWNPSCTPDASQVVFSGVLDSGTGCYTVGFVILDEIIQ